MPYEESGATVLRQDLGEAAYEYMIEGEQAGFIGAEIMPIKEVPKQKGNYPKMKVEMMFKSHGSLKRAPRTNYKRSDWEFGTGSYECEDYGFEDLLDATEKSLYSSYFDAEVISTQRATFQLLMAQEIRIANMVMNTTNITTNQAAAAVWSVAADAKPRTDIAALKTKMRNDRGIIPNVLALAKSLFDELMLTAEITDAFKYTNPIEIGGFEAQKRIMAQYFGVDKVLVGNAIKDTAKKGQTASLSDIWSSTLVGLFKISTSEDLRDPAIGRTFLWTEDSPQSLVVEEYEEPGKRSRVFRARQNVDEEFIYTGAGGLVTGV